MSGWGVALNFACYIVVFFFFILDFEFYNFCGFGEKWLFFFLFFVCVGRGRGSEGRRVLAICRYFVCVCEGGGYHFQNCLLQSPGYPKRDKPEPLPYWIDLQVDLSLCSSHRFYCRFCRALVTEVLL